MSAAQDAIRWHDLECGGYDVDAPLWRDLATEAAARTPGRAPAVLDVGAGTGRVSLDLARRGLAVSALDVEEALLAELARKARAEGLPVQTLLADARELAVGARYDLVLVPMQTIQLLEGPPGRARFLARVKEHLRPGGRFAAALADALEGYDEEHTEPPLPDMRDFRGTVYASRPIAVVDVGDGMVIRRMREIVDPAGRRTVTEDAIKLDTLDAATLEAELRVAGLEPEPPRLVPATAEYVGSIVVVAHA